MWVCMCEVEVSERVCWEEFVCKFEGVYEGPDFLDDVGDSLVIFEVVLHGDAQEGGVSILFEDCILDGELDWFWFVWEEDGVVCFGWVWDQVVGVEVSDEIAEF